MRRREFQQLYRRYAADVYRFSFWLCGDEADADDLTAETFVRAWTARQRIQVETVKTYLLTIARNLYLKRGRRPRAEVALEAVQPLDPRPGGERSLLDREELAAVLAALAEIAEIDRTAFLLRVGSDLPYAEIARALGINVSAARVKVHRVRLRLALSRSSQVDEEKEDGDHA